jgi:hypothetical protein
MAGLGSGIAAGAALADQMRNAMNGGGTVGGQQAPQNVAPPPIPQAISYFVAINGQQQGPFDLPTLTAKARDGSLTRTTLVWRAGMANWAAAGQVAEFSGAFAAVPPPIPGA